MKRKPDPPLSRTGMRRAAHWLSVWARAIAESETVGGKWPSFPVSVLRAKNEHDELMRLSRQLYAKARQS